MLKYILCYYFYVIIILETDKNSNKISNIFFVSIFTQQLKYSKEFRRRKKHRKFYFLCLFLKMFQHNAKYSSMFSVFMLLLPPNNRHMTINISSRKGIKRKQIFSHTHMCNQIAKIQMIKWWHAHTQKNLCLRDKMCGAGTQMTHQTFLHTNYTSSNYNILSHITLNYSCKYSNIILQMVTKTVFEFTKPTM